MNKAKELKDIISITELDPSKIYLMGVDEKETSIEDATIIYNNLFKAGIRVWIVPEGWIKSNIEISEEEAKWIKERIKER